MSFSCERATVAPQCSCAPSATTLCSPVCQQQCVQACLAQQQPVEQCQPICQTTCSNACQHIPAPSSLPIPQVSFPQSGPGVSSSVVYAGAPPPLYAVQPATIAPYPPMPLPQPILLSTPPTSCQCQPHEPNCQCACVPHCTDACIKKCPVSQNCAPTCASSCESACSFQHVVDPTPPPFYSDCPSKCVPSCRKACVRPQDAAINGVVCQDACVNMCQANCQLTQLNSQMRNDALQPGPQPPIPPQVQSLPVNYVQPHYSVDPVQPTISYPPYHLHDQEPFSLQYLQKYVTGERQPIAQPLHDTRQQLQPVPVPVAPTVPQPVIPHPTQPYLNPILPVNRGSVIQPAPQLTPQSIFREGQQTHTVLPVNKPTPVPTLPGPPQPSQAVLPQDAQKLLQIFNFQPPQRDLTQPQSLREVLSSCVPSCMPGCKPACTVKFIEQFNPTAHRSIPRWHSNSIDATEEVTRLYEPSDLIKVKPRTAAIFTLDKKNGADDFLKPLSDQEVSAPTPFFHQVKFQSPVNITSNSLQPKIFQHLFNDPQYGPTLALNIQFPAPQRDCIAECRPHCTPQCVEQNMNGLRVVATEARTFFRKRFNKLKEDKEVMTNKIVMANPEVKDDIVKEVLQDAPVSLQ